METRLTPRVQLELKIIVQIDEETQQKFHLAKGNTFGVDILDISIGGIGVFSKYFLPKGLLLEVQIEGKPFGLDEPMKIKSRVCYCNYIKSSRYRCGIMFIDIPDDYKNNIAVFIRTYERRKEPRVKLSE